MRFVSRAAPVMLAAVSLAAEAPVLDVTLWKQPGISSPQFESHPAFDPRTGDFYFVRSTPAFEGWRILVSRCGGKGWLPPESPAFAGPGVEADPFFTADGGSLYFISSRAAGSSSSKDLDIWRVDRHRDGSWGAPTRLPEPINSSEAEWFPRIAPDGWLYFGSERAGGLGKSDIWRARAGPDGRWTVENLGPDVNTARNEYEPLPSPDGSRLLVMTDEGYFESRRTESGWSSRRKLGPEINANGTEIGALFSPSGWSMLLARSTKGPDSGELFLVRERGQEAWPPVCGQTGKSP